MTTMMMAVIRHNLGPTLPELRWKLFIRNFAQCNRNVELLLCLRRPTM